MVPRSGMDHPPMLALLREIIYNKQNAEVYKEGSRARRGSAC